MADYNIDAIIADVGGTWTDRGIKSPAVAMQKIYSANGVDITMEEARVPMGAHKFIHLQQIYNWHSRVQEAWRESHHGKDPTREDFLRMFDLFVPTQEGLLISYNNLIDGTLEFREGLYERGTPLGLTTGFTGNMPFNILLPDCLEKGFHPDAGVASTGHYGVWNESTNGFDRGEINSRPFKLNSQEQAPKDWTISRPYMHMASLNAALFGVDDYKRCVKMGDTLPDIEEARGGMWMIFLALTGNEVPYDKEEWEALPKRRQKQLRDDAYGKGYAKGADVVIDGIWDALPALDEISDKIGRGELPRSITEAKYR